MNEKRKNGTGTVRQRADGRWEGRVIVGYTVSGKPKQKSVYGKTKGECIGKIKGISSSVKKISPSMPFGKWIQCWYEQHQKPKLRVSTQVLTEGILRNHILRDKIAAMPLDQITRTVLEQYYARQKKQGSAKIINGPLSDRTVRLIHAVCRQALAQAAKQKLIGDNPAVGAKIPPKRTAPARVLTRSELIRFLAQARYDGFFELFLLALTTGLRRGELLALQWCDVNFNTGELRINKQISFIRGQLVVTPPKNRASIRTLILAKPVLKVLENYRATVTSRWLFPSPIRDDLPRHPQTILKILHRILARAECQTIRVHDLRHTFATYALAGGLDAKTLSYVIGHASVATTLDIYAHSTEEMQRRAAVNIERRIGGNPDAELLSQPQGLDSVQGEKFTPRDGKRRKSGRGGIYQINEHLFEGRYSPVWPDGTRRAKNVYAKTREECQIKLTELIDKMNEERNSMLTKIRGEKDA